MNEYFNWVNVDKREYLTPCDFLTGVIDYESARRGNTSIKALCELLATDWNGDHVFYLGDSCSAPNDIAPELFLRLCRHPGPYSEYDILYDMVYEKFTNISGLFRASEFSVRGEIEYYLDDLRRGASGLVNQYGIKHAKPYDGLFEREVRDVKYVLNYTRKLACSFEETKLLYQDGSDCTTLDPLPLLLGFGNTVAGPWIGDKIGASDELPEGFRILDEIILDR